MLGGVLSGVANLTADAYGYQGTPTQNATIAANVIYNVVTCGAAGGGSSGGSGSGSGQSSSLQNRPRITPTQENWPGTNIPKSFTVTLSDGSGYWVHPHALEHVVNEVIVNGPASESRLADQIILESLADAISTAHQQGIVYYERMYIGQWELIFRPSREMGKLPAIIHGVLRYDR